LLFLFIILLMSEEEVLFCDNNYENFVKICSRNKNDENNKIREKMLKIFIENYGNKDIEFKKCYDIFNNLSVLFNKEGFQKIYNIKHLGGLNTKDFVIGCLKDNENINIDIDFKFNCKTIDKLPEIKQIYTNNSNSFVKKIYNKFYYENYLDKLLVFLKNKDIELKKPEYEIYIKLINVFNKNKMDDFFKELKTYNDKYKKEYKKIVDESISEYLKIHCVKDLIDIDVISEHLKSVKKTYLLFKDNYFYFDKIENIKIKSFEKIKNNNILVFSTYKNENIEMLLRWKNGAGIIGSAWQISIKRN